MMKRTIIFLAVVFAAQLGCDKNEPTDTRGAASAPADTRAATNAPAPWAPTRVEAAKVCMVNDRFMGSSQIPVAVGGKTYYGCCAGCERRLREDETVRYGIDPVTKKRVDKATAVIGKLDSGSVLYFENEDTLRKYLP